MTYTQQQVDKLKDIIKGLESRCENLKDLANQSEAKADAQKLIVRELRSIILESMSHE